jgi:hypothetical protein
MDENKKKELYSDIEEIIIRWSIDGTKTAGSLTRDIMKLIDAEIRDEKLKELGILCDTEISQSEILGDAEIPQKSGI